MATSPKDPVQRVADVKSADQEPTARVSTEPDNTPDVAPDAGAAEPAKKNLAAVRMMTKSIAFAKPSTAKGMARQVADEGKPSQKPAGGGSSRPRRRGASKGR